MILRVLGPLVIILSLVVLGTGLGLLAEKPGHEGLLLFAHKASFILWLGVTAIHVLGHLREAAVASWQEVRPASGDPASRRRFLRLAAVALSLAVGIGAAAAITPHATSWTGSTFQQFRHDGSAAAPAEAVRKPQHGPQHPSLHLRQIWLTRAPATLGW